MRAFSLHLKWAPLPAELSHIEPKISAAFEAWSKTKYRSGQSCKGVDADCIGYACGIIDEVDGRKRAQSATLPSDAALHNPQLAEKAVLAIRRLYDPADFVLPDESGIIHAQPMDILVVASGAGGPGHMMLVGIEQNTLWHCSPMSGANKSGWKLFSGNERVFALYRLGDRGNWKV